MRNIIFRNYTDISGITDDYLKVREFFIERGRCEFTHGRWDWMTTHSYLDKNNISRIGLWEENGKIVAVATFDCQPGETFLITLPEYEDLKQDMIEYATKALNINENFSLVISDTDKYYQGVAAKNGFVAITDKEADAIFYPEQTSLEYSLPEGFSITDMEHSFDMYQYGRVLWKGFNHELDGEGAYQHTADKEQVLKAEMIRSNVDLRLKIAVVAPDGNFVSYCGMWYDKKSDYAVIEPVATAPDYRKMGLGKAVVLEGIKRVYEMGARFVLVGSSQQFYYSIGMRPFANATKWKKISAKQ